jgi:hypothetical protein
MRSQVSHAPQSPSKGDRSASLSGGRDITNASTTITSSSGNWQTYSKDICTFQTESSAGSPILHSIWNKSGKKANHTRTKSHGITNYTTAVAVHSSLPGITYEQKKMHFYDDVMMDVEKQGYQAGAPWTPPRKTMHDSGMIYTDEVNYRNRQMPFSAESPTKSFTSIDHHHEGAALFDFSSPPPSLHTDKGLSSGAAYDGQQSKNPFHTITPAAPNSSSPACSTNAPPKKMNEGVSIRSIRANMEFATSFDQVDSAPRVPSKATRPIKPSRPQTSPETNKPSAIHTSKDLYPKEQSPTFEISPGLPVRPKATLTRSVDEGGFISGSPYPFTTSHQQSPSSQHTILPQTSMTSLQTAYYDSSEAYTESHPGHDAAPRLPSDGPSEVPTKSSATAFNNPPRKQSCNSATNTVLEIDEELD